MVLNRKTAGTIFLASAILMTIGCSKDEETVEPIVEEPTSVPTYTVPSTYAFLDGVGASTVSFGGQQQRLEMLSEMVTYMKTANTAGTAVVAQTLKDMYANSAYTWIDAPVLGMTGSTKQLKSKTASADVGVQTMFEAYMDDIAAISNGSVSNSSETYGTAGVWTNGTKNYLMAGNGYEYTQLIEKGLMCAVFMNQMTNNYLQSVGSDDNTIILTGKNYTTMQHHWDEAYGYFTSEFDYPTNGTNRFWGKYADGREGVLGSATKIATAFRTGRAAINNNDYTVRDAQITIIVNEMEKVCAGTAIHYLNGAKAIIADPTKKNHELSEARAFVNGLKYGQNSISGNGMLTADINTALAYFSDFENVSIADLNNAIDLIASKTGLTNVKSSL
ncbi:MAG: DUF4856 domain-containing protein [Flavobacteriales bacterium]|nr:DUF4856 domain-containing protein [Flavobacteriales bacterium]